jgi:hypothetical protein
LLGLEGDREADGFEPVGDARAYFEPQVALAVRAVGVPEASQAEPYLVDLLCGFAVSTETPAPESLPLADLLRRAAESVGPERERRMRRLGDVALWLSGFLPDCFERRGLSEAYVARMGGGAYSWLGEAAHRCGEPSRAKLFHDLSARFRDFARVLDEVRELTAMCTDGAVVRLYERWRATGSPALLRRLVRRGVTPATPTPVRGTLN